MKPFSFLFFILLILSSGCYTILTHPKVDYLHKLGVSDTSNISDEIALSDVNYNDNCLNCHQDYTYQKYFQTVQRTNDLKNDAPSKIKQFSEIPWWSNTIWEMDDHSDNTENTSRRSKRSYHKTASGSTNEIQYMAAPGVIPLNIKSVKETSTNGKTSSSSITPTRQKEAPVDAEKSKPTTIKKTKKKKKPVRRR